MKIEYIFKTSRRARRVRLSVRAGGAVTVIRPTSVSESFVRQFILTKSAWLRRAVARMQKLPPRISLPRISYASSKERARSFIIQRLKELDAEQEFSYRSVTIRNQKTRWGSCSRRGTLSFNYHLLLLPQHLVDYVLVHELCHLAEFNHSRRFWLLLGKRIPDYVNRRSELRRYDLRLR